MRASIPETKQVSSEMLQPNERMPSMRAPPPGRAAANRITASAPDEKPAKMTRFAPVRSVVWRRKCRNSVK